MESEYKGSKFVVDFGGADLPPEVAKLMQANIQEAVLRTVARLDFKGDITFKLPPDVWGLVWDGRFEGINEFPR